MLSVRQTQRLICRNVPEQLQHPNECSETTALILVSLRLITGSLSISSCLQERDTLGKYPIVNQSQQLLVLWQKTHLENNGQKHTHTKSVWQTETRTRAHTHTHTHTHTHWRPELSPCFWDDDRIIKSITFSHLESPFAHSLSDFLRTAVRCKRVCVCVLQESTSKY